jgi:hypothetical protein
MGLSTCTLGATTICAETWKLNPGSRGHGSNQYFQVTFYHTKVVSKLSEDIYLGLLKNTGVNVIVFYFLLIQPFKVT